ncbi:LytR/AlgR family response regulator transcription factor [Bacteroides stercorirosoris]|uniref:Response regulator n=1 Tax=Bacteroides stercorirosoris TaxID=871324 RepID=A0A413H1V7_9BACE|nr:response regulator [Bacteroides stercorirosoris]RGX77449.1 response regulator [Bacteroides stercorirosoris]
MFTYSVILVDDEQAAHYAMQSLFRKYDEINLIGQAYNGRQAIEKINSLRPDLIFLDIQMPDMNGFEVLKHLAYQPILYFVQPMTSMQ